MVNNTDIPVDPENEAYEMPPEVNLLWYLLFMPTGERQRQGTECWSCASVAQAGTVSCRVKGEISLWPKSL